MQDVEDGADADADADAGHGYAHAHAHADADADAAGDADADTDADTDADDDADADGKARPKPSWLEGTVSPRDQQTLLREKQLEGPTKSVKVLCIVNVDICFAIALGVVFCALLCDAL